MFWFLVLLIIVGAGFYFYQRMRALEQEIRAEQAREKELQQSDRKGEKVVAAAATAEPDSSDTASVTEVEQPPVVESNPVYEVIHNSPGLVQTDLYSRFPEMSRKQLQQVVRNLVEQGQVRRERSGSSYQLFPV